MSKKTPQKNKRKSAGKNWRDGGTTSVSDADLSRDVTLSPECLPTPQFSPIAVKSPGSGHRGGQLTGLPRKVKDSCADWHNHIMAWDNLNTQGVNIISQISNAKIEASSNIEIEIGTTADLSTVLPTGLEGLCTQLRDVYTKMENLVTKMKKITSSLMGVSILDDSHHDDSFTGQQMAALSLHQEETPDRQFLFLTWQTHMFYDTSQELLDMYQTELTTKRKILENVAHSRDRDMLMMYSAVWLHQPYIEINSGTLLEGMLHETGLKS